MNTIKKNSKKGFTLVELVVVIAILAILAAIAIPVVSSTIASSQRSSALSNAQTLELALKEADAMIKAGDTSVYSSGNSTTVANVVTHKSLQTMKLDASTAQTVTISGATFTLKWDKKDDKCYYICTTAGGSYKANDNLDQGITPGGKANSATDWVDIKTGLTVTSLF